jgi:hypothetical protein
MYDVVNDVLNSSQDLISKELDPKDYRSHPFRDAHEFTLQHFFCVCPENGLYSRQELNKFGESILTRIKQLDPRSVAPAYFENFEEENQFLIPGYVDVVEDLNKGLIKDPTNPKITQINPRRERNLLRMLLFPDKKHMQETVENGTNMYSIPLEEIIEYRKEKIFAIK